jgi:adenylate cyclase
MTRGHRRLAAIVMADVAGYSLLVGRNDEKTLAALKAHRREFIDAIVVRSNGRIINAAGDSLLLEFVSVVDAVRCAIAMQRGMAARNTCVPPEERIDFRIGIEIGDIIVEGEAVVGDGVNIAARLQQLAERGGICVSQSVRDQVRAKVKLPFDPMGRRQVKNIARPIDVYQLNLKDASRSGLRHICQSLLQVASIRWIAGIAGALGVGGMVLAGLPQFRDAPLGYPAPAMSVAVLPFSVRDGDAGLDSTRDAFTRSLSIALGKSIRCATVRAYDAAEFKGKRIEAPEAGKLLNVRYLLKGNMWSAGDRIVVDAELTNAHSGAQIWSERVEDGYDRLESRQDGIVAKVTRHARQALFTAELRRVGTREEPGQSAVELVLRAANVMQTRGDELQAAVEARAIIDQALALDPNLLVALQLQARALEVQRELDPHADAERLLEQIDDVSKRAIAADPAAALAWRMRAEALMNQGRLDAALEANAVARGVDDTENSLVQRSWLMIITGRPNEALALLDEAAAMNHDPSNGCREAFHRCAALLGLGRYDNAAAACEKSIAGGDRWLVHLLLTAAYAQSGDVTQMEIEKAKLVKLKPGLTIASLKSLDHNRSLPAYLRMADAHLYSGLRKAGIPEE